MEDKKLEFMSGFISSVMCDESIVRVIKQNNGFEFSREEFEKLDLQEDIEKFYCNFSDTFLVKAYEPFIDVAKSIIKKYDLNIDSLMDEANIYSLQKSVFKSMLTEKHSIREENPILGELEYERKKFISGLINLILAISVEHRIFIMINSANLMLDSTLSILEELNQKNSYTLKILLVTNEMGNVRNYIAQEYNEFVTKLEDRDAVIDIPYSSDESINKKPDFSNKEIAQYFQNDDEELANISDMFNTFAIKQAWYYLSMLYQKVELDRVRVSNEYRINMLILYIRATVYEENFSYALVLCDKLKGIESQELNNYKMYKAYYYKSMANMYIGNEEEAIRDASRCHKAAFSINEEFVSFESEMLRMMANLSGWKNIWICDKNIPIKDSFIDQCYKFGYLNHLAHIFVYYFDNDAALYSKIDDVEQRIATVTKGIYIANKIGNEQFLMEAYRKCIMMSSTNGYFNTANYFYNKTIDVVTKTQNKFEEANIYNGLGYNCCTADKYTEANRYYNKALRIFYDEKSSDYIAETLYNMGINAILAEDYAHAEEFLTTVNNILKTLKKNSLRVSNISKIFGLLAVAAFKHGNYYVARLNTNKAENFLRYILDYDIEEFSNFLWSDDIFLYMYVKGLLCAHDGNMSEAISMFDQAEEYMYRSSGSMFFNYLLYSVDKAELYKKIGRVDEANEILIKARKYFNDKGSFLHVRMFDDLIAGKKNSVTPMNMALTTVTLSDIMEQIKLENIMERAKDRKEQIKFFGTFQELINTKFETVDEEINTMIMTFKMNFNIDNMIFIDCENGIPELRFSDLSKDISDENMLKIEEYFKKNINPFVLSKYDNNYQDYDEVLNIFENMKFFSVIGAPIFREEELYGIFIMFIKIPESWNSVVEGNIFDEDDLETYMIVFRQILDAIEKNRLNEKLKMKATTDELTGALNRNGYYDFLNRIIKKNQENKEKFDFTLMYVDLDHFKFYNDNFGHQVGDDVLKRFVSIFKKVIGKHGYVTRFGGDEFLIVLNTVDKDVINGVVENIYKHIEEGKGFLDIVEKYDRDKSKVTDDTSVTCSIGVASGQGLSAIDEISILQRQADAALYYAKEHGRNKALSYEEMLKLKENE